MSDSNNAKVKGYTFNGTATEVQDLTDKNGKPYLKVRATVKLRGQDRLRTIKAEGKAREALLPVMKVGETFSVRGFFEKLPANDDGKSAEYIVALGLPKAA